MKEQKRNPQSSQTQTAPLQRSSPKIAVLHDSFLYRGGGERLVTLMAKSLGADLISGFFSEGSFDPRELGFIGNIISLGKPVFKKGIRHLVLKWRFFWKARILRDYDIVIFSGDCLSALRHVKSDAKKVYYCHTPPRYLFDFRARYLARFPRFVRSVIGKSFDYFAHTYITYLAKFDTIFTNSANVQARLKEFCGYDSTILYPPTDVERFTTKDEINSHELREYYLSFARLSPPKRVDMVVDAFLEMPEKKLVFTYGKNDPEKNMILEKIKNAKNLTAMESPDDDELIRLIGGAIATIYIPIDEDFGMSPVESMACGTPVIGVDEGGLRETVIDGETGILLPENITVNDIKDGVQKMNFEFAKSLHENCRVRANDFSLEKFQEKLESFPKPNL